MARSEGCGGAIAMGSQTPDGAMKSGIKRDPHLLDGEVIETGNNEAPPRHQLNAMTCGKPDDQSPGAD